MIDDKKIEAAKEEIYEDRFLLNGEEIVFNNDEKEEMFYEGDIKEAIGLGAKWAINEFLKDLWHPASEKPNIKQGECYVTCLIKFKNGSTELCVYFRNPEGWVCDDMSPKDFKRNFNGWLYIDELLPRREVNND
jgi:hypothetical protein